MKLKDKLKIARQDKGYSQSKLAKVLGYSSGQFISNWERGQSYPPVDRLAKMSLLFGLNHEELLRMYLIEIGEEKKKAFQKALDFHLSRVN